MHRRIVAVVAMAALGLGAAACSNDSSSSSSATSTTGPKRLDVETPAGRVTASFDGKLPAGWPSDFPVPSGAKVAGSGSLATKSKDTMVGVYTTTKPAASTFSYYTGQSSLQAHNTKKVGIGSAFLGTTDISGTYDGSVTVAGGGSSTTIVVVLRGGQGSTSTSTTSTTVAA